MKTAANPSSLILIKIMNINIVCVGKLKEDYLKSAVAEYVKRLGAFANISIIELDEARLNEKPSQKQVDSALSSEAACFEKFLSSHKGFSIALCIEGKMLSSTELAEKLQNVTVEGKSAINFLIGSSFGLDENLKKRCDMRLSVSKMTFPHQLFRVMLLEQIYRCFQINSGSKYHK